MALSRRTPNTTLRMLETILNLLDRTAELLKQRRLKDEACFDQLIEPVMDQMLTIHGEYGRFLHSLYTLAEAAPPSQISIADLSRFDEGGPQRDKCRILAIALRDCSDIPAWAQHYFRALSDYFTSPFEWDDFEEMRSDYWHDRQYPDEQFFERFVGDSRWTPATALREYLRYLDGSNSENFGAIELTRVRLDERWGMLLRAYAFARLKAKIPKGTVNS